MNKSNRDIITLNVACTISIMICIGFWVGFMHERNPWNWKGYILDTEVVGQYGDFIGGFIGTILSVILLYYTFYRQRLASEESSKMYQKQQLNDDFYHLMDLYYEIVNSFVIPDEASNFKGKEAIHACLENLIESWDDSIKISKRKQAVISYMDFYARYRDFAPIYYRTLYRICESIHDKGADTDYKNIEYIKILRAQLTDSEMILLRYNAQTRMGRKFQNYINLYNLLKHLPTLYLLEYMEFRTMLKKEPQHISALNIILSEMKQHLSDLLDNEAPNLYTMTEYKSYVTVALSTSENKDNIKITINKQKVSILSRYSTFNCIMKLDDENIQKLFSYYLYDMLILSNFQQYNIRKDIEFTNNKEEENDRTIFSFQARNRQGNPINMTWKQYTNRGKVL